MDYLKRVGRITVFRFLGIGVSVFLIWMFSNTAKPKQEIVPTFPIIPTSTPRPATPTKVNSFVETMRAGVDYYTQVAENIPDNIKNTCVSWHDVPAQKNHIDCVYGIIKGSAQPMFYDNASPNTYKLDIFYFGDSEDSYLHDFYLIVTDTQKTRFTIGDCIVIKGDISADVNGTPKADSRNSTKVNLCSEGS